MRLIDADAIDKRYVPIAPVIEGDAVHYEWVAFIDDINELPTIDAVPVRHGKWRFVNCATGLRCQCSECLHWVDAGTDKNYCPNCGARMDEE